jgi:3-hydroxyacyl-[acyl-carrier-protein] dehydratase
MTNDPITLASEADKARVLEVLPQKEPFRFIDSIVELSEKHIVAQRRFRHDEYYYKGHFPDAPVTPGVILLETMAQAGLVALGIYIVRNEPNALKIRTLFSDCAVDFLNVVYPGNLVTVRGELVFWRRNKMKCKIDLTLEDGTVAATGHLSGFGVAI